MSQATRRTTIAALAVMAVVLISLLVRQRGTEPVTEYELLGAKEMLRPGDTTTSTGSQTTVTTNMAPREWTVRIGPSHDGLELDPVEVECHGGVALARWYVGNLEPINPSSGIHLTMTMDSEPLSTALVGSTDGIWNDQPATIEAVVDCPAGARTFAVVVDGITGFWGIPYVQTPGDSYTYPVQRGMTVREVW